MSLRIRSRLALILGLLLLAGWLGYAYWQISNLDPEGGCKELKYWSFCARAWERTWGGLGWHFQSLPTDQEMIDRFKTYRSDFEEMAEEITRASYIGIVILDRKWADKLDLSVAESIVSYPQTQDDKTRNILRSWAYLLRVADTRYVRGATHRDLDMLLRTKGYVYFRSPPQIEGGYLVPLPNHWKLVTPVLPSLDGPPWPSDWKSGNCWLRQIEPQWFLALCRDMVGG